MASTRRRPPHGSIGDGMDVERDGARSWSPAAASAASLRVRLGGIAARDDHAWRRPAPTPTRSPRRCRRSHRGEGDLVRTSRTPGGSPRFAEGSNASAMRAQASSTLLRAEEAARAERHHGDEQQVHRQQRPFGRVRAGDADDHPDHQRGDTAPHKLPDTAQHDDQERRDDGVDADVRPHAPDRRHHHAGERRPARRPARTRARRSRARSMPSARTISLSCAPALIIAP